MKRKTFLIVCLLVVSSCGGRSDLFTDHGDYLGGNQAAAIGLACHKRGGGVKDSVAYDLCVQSQKIHYK